MRARLAGIVALAAAIALPASLTGAQAVAAQAQATVQAGTLQTAAAAAGKAKANKGKKKGAAVRSAAVSPNPKIDETCGLDVTLTLDSSGSIGSNANNVKQAASDFAAALKNTNSTMRITRFSKTSSQLAARVPVNDTTTGPGGSLANGITNYPKPSGGTNWQEGFNFTKTGDSLVPELLIFVTDGDPTLWGADGSGGTGQVQQPNINNSLAQAIPAANSVKAQTSNRTRVLMVGVGNGVNNSSSRQRMTEVSGPNIVTSAGGLSGKSINDVDVAAFTDFEALGAFLRSVVTSLCGNSVTIQKLAQSPSSAQYLPATGWDMTVTPKVTGGVTWVTPNPGSGDSRTAATSGAQGSAAFQWKPKTPQTGESTVSVSETLKTDYRAQNWTCDVKKPNGTVVTKSGTFTGGATGFDFQMASSDVATCKIYNDFTGAPGIELTKVAADDPIRGNGAGWNELYTLTVKNTGKTTLEVTAPIDPKCSAMSAPSGPGAPAGPLQPGDTWTYTCSRLIGPLGTVTTPLTESNRATVTGRPPMGTPVTDEATEVVVVKTPAIDVQKTARVTATDAPINEGDTLPAGTKVTYSYAVTSNQGNDALRVSKANNGGVTDTKCTPVTYVSGDTNSNNLLDLTETWTYECTTRLLPSSQDGTVRNVATATGKWSNPENKPQNNGDVTDTDDFTIKTSSVANLRVVKSTVPGQVNEEFDYTLVATGGGGGIPSGDDAFSLNTGNVPGAQASINVELDGPAALGTEYVITEAGNSDFELTDIGCVAEDGTPVGTGDVGNRTATVTLVPDDNVTCSFRNQRLPDLTITKRATGGGSTEFDFTTDRPGPLDPLDPATFSLANDESQVYDAIEPGEATIAEDTLPAGWEIEDISCTKTPTSQTSTSVTLDLEYGDDVDCIFNNSEIPPATLTVIKKGNPTQSPSFDFTAQGIGLLTPDVDDTDDFTLSAGESKTYNVRPQVNGDDYVITETGPTVPTPAGDSAWELTSIECTVNGGTPFSGNVNLGSVEVTLEPSDSAVCTYVNEQLPRLQIVKNVVNPADPGDATQFTFTPTGLTPADPFDLGNNDVETFVDVAPGDPFTVDETGIGTWTLTSLECTGPGSEDVVTTDVLTGVVSSTGLDYGADVVCRYVNTKEAAAAYLFVVKNTDPATSPQEFDFTATGNNQSPPNLNETFSLTGGDYQGFEIDPGFAPGEEYTVTEALVAGWRIAELDCVVSTDPETIVDGDVDTGEVTVPVEQGEVAVCVYENQKLGSLSVNKITDVTSATEFDFTATSTPAGITPGEFTLTGGGSPQVFQDIVPATVVEISENVPTDAPDRWQLSNIECTGTDTPPTFPDADTVSITVGAGEDVSCSFVDTKVPESTVQVIKVADPSDGTVFGFTADAPGDTAAVAEADRAFDLAPDGGPAEHTVTLYPAPGGQSFIFGEDLPLPEDWNLLAIECTDNGVDVGTEDLGAGTIDVDIEPGHNLVCTFTDREDATLTIVKEAEDDPTLEFDFEWTAGANFSMSQDSSPTIATGLEPGAYDVAEVNLPTDWYLSGPNGEHPDCVGTDAAVDYTPANGATLDIAAGEDVVCTFANFYDYRPDIQLTKTADRTVLLQGNSVVYTYVVENVGNTDLIDIDPDAVIVDDPVCDPITRTVGAGTTLAVGESWTYECTQTLDADRTNTATATVPNPIVPDEPLISRDDEFVKVLVPSFEVEKNADQSVVYPDTLVTYSYTLRNTGQTPYEGPTNRDEWMSDDKCAPVTYVEGDTNDDSILDVGEQWIYTCATTLTTTTTNTVVATGTPFVPESPESGDKQTGPPQETTDTELVTVVVKDIDVAKSATAEGGTVIDGVVNFPAGGRVTYTYDVTTGDATTPMQVLSISDDKCSPVAYVSGDTNTNDMVDPGETWKYQCSTVVEGAQTVTNTVVVVALEPLVGGTSTSTDSETVKSFVAGIEVEKTPSADLVPTGTAVTYTYRVRNTGTETLNTITIADDKCSPVTYQSGDSNGDGLLQITETWVYTCVSTLTRTTTNVVDLTGKTPTGATVGGTSSAQVQIFNPANLDAKIKVKKSANKTKVKKGKRVTYTYKVSNPGKVGLAKVKKNVTDNKCKRVRYIKGDKDGNGILTSARSGGETGAEVWTFRCKTTLKKTTVNTVTAKGKGWLNGEIVGPTVKDKDKAKVRVIKDGGGALG